MAAAGGRDIVDWWNLMSRGLRQYLRGWSRNMGREARIRKLDLVSQISALDQKADSVGIDEEEWAFRYHLEEQLLQIHRLEEEYWRQRGRVRWTLQGDANTAYFHAVANGRRRKCYISLLQTDAGPIRDPKLIQDHVYSFYRDLLGTEAPRHLGLVSNTWSGATRVSDEENNSLLLTFSEEELERLVMDMKVNTAPGPDGFPVAFFKKCWPLCKLGVLHILNDFILGRIDIARLNFGVLSLIPKSPRADRITQFRPIALINVIFKIISKAFASRLDPIANRIISPTQTAFLKGRFILDGALALLEVVHELKSNKLGGVLLKLDFEKAYDRVNWSFLIEVLRRKGFDAGYIHKIQQLVSGGQMAISINGEVGPFFRNKQGVRQGDPLSLILFNFVVEALSAILSAAAAAGHIKGVVPHLYPGGLTHLQYADDTLILIQNEELDIANLKFLLLCFEDMSGLKINFHKSEIYVLDRPPLEQQRIAHMFNCKLGEFPFMYLGLPISDHKLTIEQWNYLVNKLADRVQVWMGRLLSSGGRLILSNACLEALPTFAMGLFLLQDGVHAKFDSIRARFFWEGSGPKRKHHWLNWPAVCRPKDCGGLGLTNTKNMNIALILKWVWRLFQDDESIWHKLVVAKYPEADNIFAATSCGGSQFWRAIHKIKHFFKLGAKYVVRSGGRTAFWTDWWVGDSPLSTRFPRLFAVCSNPAILVADAFAPDSSGIGFRRALDQEGMAQWRDLLSLLDAVELQEGRDEVRWALEQTGVYSVSSMYRLLSQGATVAYADDIWDSRLPLKVKIFMWQLVLDRLPTCRQLAAHLGTSNGTCALCGEAEDASHVFFSCPMARFGWSVVRQLLGCSWSPANFPQFFACLQPLLGQRRRLCWILVAVMFWSLWVTRNKLALEAKALRHPSDLIYKLFMFLQTWAGLSKVGDRDALLEMASALKAIYSSVAPPSIH